jgi:hypothetical protein
MAHPAGDTGGLVWRLVHGGRHLGVHVLHHPHHGARHVLGWFGVSREIIHRVARSIENVAVIAGHTQCSREGLHRGDDLCSWRIFREHLQVL